MFCWLTFRGKFPIHTSKNVSINEDPGRNSKDQGPPMQWVLLVVFHSICCLSGIGHLKAALLF